MSKFTFENQTAFYQGKVRDVYTINDTLLVMVASDRISAFDVILPKPIPYKGQVLNEIASKMLEATRDICPNWLLNVPAPHISIGKRCTPFKIEMVVRGNLTGHSWRVYAQGLRTLCGVHLEEGLKENDYFKTPIITPTTKADAGHDEDISKEAIIANSLVSAPEWEILSDYSLRLFERGRKLANERGLILADTKYEFGKIGDEIYLMDEIHTPDSSRYFYLENFEDNQNKGLKQKQLSKEFVREWLIANDFMGKEGQTIPEMSSEWIDTISKRYIELYEKITGEYFIPKPMDKMQVKNEITQNLNKLLISNMN